MNEIFDTIIIGGGPAGLAAAKHLGFFKRNILIIDRKVSPLYYLGNPVHNYPGVVRNLTGQALLRQMQGEAQAAGAKLIFAGVNSISGKFPNFKIETSELNGRNQTKVFAARTILMATGAAVAHPKLDHDWKNWLHFASEPKACYYCFDCEAPFMKDKSVLIISVGTINQAVYAAKTLSRFASDVEILVTADSYLPFKPEDMANLKASGFRWSTGTIKSAQFVAPGIKQSVVTHENKKINCNCFFVSTIRLPRSEVAKCIGVETNNHGAILTNQQGQTNVEGIWAAGDVTPIARQITVAAGSGHNAGLMINRALLEI